MIRPLEMGDFWWWLVDNNDSTQASLGGWKEKFVKECNIKSRIICSLSLGHQCYDINLSLSRGRHRNLESCYIPTNTNADHSNGRRNIPQSLACKLKNILHFMLNLSWQMKEKPFVWRRVCHYSHLAGSQFCSSIYKISIDFKIVSHEKWDIMGVRFSVRFMVLLGR